MNNKSLQRNSFGNVKSAKRYSFIHLQRQCFTKCLTFFSNFTFQYLICFCDICTSLSWSWSVNISGILRFKLPCLLSNTKWHKIKGKDAYLLLPFKVKKINSGFCTQKFSRMQRYIQQHDEVELSALGMGTLFQPLSSPPIIEVMLRNIILFLFFNL